jgi:hypothetical protein
VQPIDEDTDWPDPKAFDGPLHGQKGRVVDVEPVDLLMGRPSHGPCDRLLPDAGGCPKPAGGGEDLGVREDLDRELGGKDNGSGSDRTRDWASAGLIDAADQLLHDSSLLDHPRFWVLNTGSS